MTVRLNSERPESQFLAGQSSRLHMDFEGPKEVCICKVCYARPEEQYVTLSNSKVSTVNDCCCAGSDRAMVGGVYATIIS